MKCNYTKETRTTFDALITYIARATQLDKSQEVRDRLKGLYQDLRALPFGKTLNMLSSKQRIKYYLLLVCPQLLQQIVKTNSENYKS